MEETTIYAVELNNVVKKYGFHTPLKGVNLHVPEDSVFALVGPDETGKRLIFELISHICSPASGEIYLSGMKETSIHHSPVGLYLKNTGMVPEWSIYHNFFHMAAYRKLDPKLTQIREILKLFGLKKCGFKLTGSLSPKVRSMAGIAMAFLGWPGIVLLEDPFAYLDDNEIKMLSAILNKIKSEKHCSIIISCLDTNNLSGIADCYGILIDGKIEEELLEEEIPEDHQREIHIRVEQIKKAKSVLSDYKPELLDGGWIILNDPGITTTDAFNLLMKHKVDVYELKEYQSDSLNYINRYISKAKGEIYGS